MTVTAEVDAGVGEAEEDAAALGKIGRFVIQRRLGAGGMGVVYLAHDDDLDRKVAIKVIRRRLAGDEAIALRMQREAQAMARIHHPNVLGVYEVDLDADRLFIAMEYVDGETLGAAMRRRGPPRSANDRRELLALWTQAGRGLQAAHDAGLVHRDFKPDNVLLDAQGGVRVADFGLARAQGRVDRVDGGGEGLETDPSALAVDVTATRAILGTPAYMAPEQHAGMPTDARTDVFAFCVGLHEALHGERPFAGDTLEALATATWREDVRPPPPESATPPWLHAVIVRGLRRDPDARWPSMAALLDALADDPELRRRRRARIGGVAVVGAIGAVALVARLSGDAARIDEASARASAQEVIATEASAARDDALARAEASAREARDHLRMAVLRDAAGDPTTASLILAEVEDPAAPEWRGAAQGALAQAISAAILRGDESEVLAAAFLGDRVVVHTRRGRLRVFRRDGRGRPQEVEVGIDAMVAIDDERIAVPIVDREVAIYRRTGDGALTRERTLEGAPERVAALRVDPAGARLVAVGVASKAAVVWELASGRRIAELGCDDSPILKVDVDVDRLLITHDEPRLCVVDLADPEFATRRLDVNDLSQLILGAGERVLLHGEGRARAWSPRSGEMTPLFDYEEPSRFGQDPLGRLLPIRDHRGRLVLIALDDGRRVADLGLVARRLGQVTISRDGAWMAALDDGRVHLWRVDDLQRRAVLRLPKNDHDLLVFADDGRWLAAATTTGDVHVWDVASIERPLHLSAEEQTIHGLRVAGDEAQVVALADNSVRWWTIPGAIGPARTLGGEVGPNITPQLGADLEVAAVSHRYDIVLVGRDGAKRTLHGHTGLVWGLAFGADDRRLLSTSEDGTARSWDLAGADPEASAIVLRGHPAEVVDGGLDPAGRRAFTLDEDGGLRLWDLAAADPGASAIVLDAGDPGGTRGASFSPDGRWLLALTRGGEAVLHDVTGGGPARVLVARESRASAWSSVGPRVAVAVGDGTLRLFDLAGLGGEGSTSGSPGVEVNARTTSAGEAQALAAARNGGTSVAGRGTAAGDGGTSTRPVKGPDPAIAANAHTSGASPGNAPTTAGGVVAPPTDAAAGEVPPYVVHRAPGRLLRHLVFSPDGRSIAAATDDDRILLWPAERAGEAEPRVSESGLVASMAFSADGRRLYYGTRGGEVASWAPSFDFDADPAALQAALRARTTACLTARQREWLLREEVAVAAARARGCEAEYGR